MVEFRLLGPVEAWAAQRRLEIGPPQHRLVLAALLVDAGRVVTTETLVDRVWGDRPPMGARRSLHAIVSRLRQVLRQADLTGSRSPDVVYRSGGYLLDIDGGGVDWHRFLDLLDAARREPSDLDRARLLRQALDLWRGTPLAGLPGDWAARTRENWGPRRLDAAVSWAEAELGAGRSGEVIGPVRELVDEYPLAEPLMAVLMRALVAASRPAEALDRYAAARARLVGELGAEPGSELQALHQAILRGQLRPAAEGHAPTVEPPVDTTARAVALAQLPSDVRGFAGRADELARLDAVLDGAATGSRSLVIAAVTGTAGVGKTALAVHWAHRVRARFPDGQMYLNLRGFDTGGSAMTPAEALRVLLDGLGVASERVPQDPDARAGLYRSLMAGRRMLVLLDNARDAEQVRALLPGTPTSLIVVTSRDQLTPLVAGSGTHPLVLDLLRPAEARQLLANRLGSQRVETEPDAVEKIIEVCARLPLALAIAAARAQQSRFALSVIAEELCDVDQRLDALDAGDPTSQVRTALSWSYAALTPGASQIFRLLGLHPGPDISLAAVASLAGRSRLVVRALLAELARSNLAVEHVPRRYTLHDLLRVYAAELAHAVDGVDQRRIAMTRLLDHYIHTAVAADRILREQRDPLALPLAPPEPGVCLVELSDRAAATDFLAVEHRNLLAGVRYAADGGFHAHAVQGAWAMDTFHRGNGYWQEAMDAGHCAIAAAGRLGDAVARAQAHRGLAPAFTMSGRHGESEAHLRQALDLYIEAGDRAEQARTHGYLVSLFLRQGDARQALDHAQQQLALTEGSGDIRALAYATNDVGWCHALLGQHDEAMGHCRRAIELIRGVGDTYGEATIWDSLGYVYHQRAEYGQAVTSYQHALALLRDRSSRSCLSETLERLGDTHYAAGDADSARDAWREALDLLVDLGRLQTADAVRSKLDTAGVSS